jgi:hypothetical protein
MGPAMPTLGAGASKRWTATRPDEEIKPVGPHDCLLKAIEKLGPFEHRLQDEAQRLGPRKGLDGRIGLSEELAFEKIWTLATFYNRQKRLNQNAPRPKQVVDRLAKIETLAGELARHLEALDDITRQRLQTAGTGIASFGEVSKLPLMEEADVPGLPPPPGWADPDTPARWVQRLKALSQYSNFCQTMFLHREGIEGPDHPDKGGNTNLYKALYGSPQWGLVSAGWHAYELFKPGQATGTEGGPFHLFLLDVFEYATGLDPEEHSKLTYWLKQVSSANRQYREIMRRQKALKTEMAEIWKCTSDRTSKKALRRFEEITNEILALERDRLELWPALWPYSYPERRGK